MAKAAGIDQIKDRYAYLLANADVQELLCWNLTNSGEKLDDEAYVENAEQNISDFVEKINEALLLEVSAAYYRDMVCYKENNETLIGDKFKKAAFTIKWVSKIRPIQIAYFQGIKKLYLLSNTIFALFAGLNMLEVNMKKIPTTYYKHLLYVVEFRNISALQFASQLYLLEKSYK